MTSNENANLSLPENKFKPANGRNVVDQVSVDKKTIHVKKIEAAAWKQPLQIHQSQKYILHRNKVRNSIGVELKLTQDAPLALVSNKDIEASSPYNTKPRDSSLLMHNTMQFLHQKSITTKSKPADKIQKS